MMNTWTPEGGGMTGAFPSMTFEKGAMRLEVPFNNSITAVTIDVHSI